MAWVTRGLKLVVPCPEGLTFDQSAKHAAVELRLHARGTGPLRVSCRRAHGAAGHPCSNFGRTVSQRGHPFQPSAARGSSASTSSPTEEPVAVLDLKKGGEHKGVPEGVENAHREDTRPSTEGAAEREGEPGSSGSEDPLSSDPEDLQRLEEEVEQGYTMKKVCDRLAEVFLREKPEADEWRKLLAFSSEWGNIRPWFFKRLKQRAGEEEDVVKRAELNKLARQLKEVDQEMERHNALLADVERDLQELDVLVGRRRTAFTGDFFAYLRLLADASYDNPARREELTVIGGKVLVALETHDSMVKDDVALVDAQTKLDKILAAPSLEAAAATIEDMGSKGEVDPTLLLLMSKAYAAAKETDLVQEEAQDIMYHLYKLALGNMQRYVPKPVRILRHLLSIEDPEERLDGLRQAFTPGDEEEKWANTDVDILYTTPLELHGWMTTILEAYNAKKNNTLIKEAAQLMNPLVIQRISVLKEQLEREFL